MQNKDESMILWFKWISVLHGATLEWVAWIFTAEEMVDGGLKCLPNVFGLFHNIMRFNWIQMWYND